MARSLTVYTFNELSPEAQERALRDMRPDYCEYTSQECMDSLRAFAKTTGFTLKDWSIGGQGAFTKFDLSPEVKALEGPRALAWIENNILGPIRQPWGIKAPGRKYHRPGALKCCPYTGVCFDEDILDVFRERDHGQTLGDRFRSIGDALTRVIDADIEYVNSDEGKRERADSEFEGVEFHEDGRIA